MRYEGMSTTAIENKTMMTCHCLLQLAESNGEGTEQGLTLSHLNPSYLTAEIIGEKV